MEYDAFLEWARNKGWTVEERTVPLVLPEALSARYQVPEEYRAFLERVLLCSGPMETEWFLCEEHYRQEGPGEEGWNLCEEESLAAARDLLDDEMEERVRAFWNGVLPFFLSVGNGYEYYGFDLEGKYGPAGCVLHGWEPDFEEPEVFADSFGEFLGKVAAGEVPLGGVLFDPEEYAFMEMAGRKEQERHQKETAQALRELLKPRPAAEKEEHREHEDCDCGCGHHHPEES